jgi:aldehyde:ferredoxin oxidoreductase
MISFEDIHEMKQKNLDKSEIISKLVEGSKSFSEKTTFSQEKVFFFVKINLSTLTKRKKNTFNMF